LSQKGIEQDAIDAFKRAYETHKQTTKSVEYGTILMILYNYAVLLRKLNHYTTALGVVKEGLVIAQQVHSVDEINYFQSELVELQKKLKLNS